MNIGRFEFLKVFADHNLKIFMEFNEGTVLLYLENGMLVLL